MSTTSEDWDTFLDSWQELKSKCDSWKQLLNEVKALETKAQLKEFQNKLKEIEENG